MARTQPEGEQMTSILLLSAVIIGVGTPLAH
jgi:hypothetical protein